MNDIALNGQPMISVFLIGLSVQVNFLESNHKYNVVGGGVLLYDETGDHEILLILRFPVLNYMYKHIPFFHPTIRCVRILMKIWVDT